MPSAEREEEEEGRRSKERKHMRRKSHSRRRHHSSGGTSSRRMRSRSRSRSGSSRSRSYSRSEKHNKRDGGGSAYIPRGAHARVGSGEKHPRGSSIRNAFSKERHKPAERGPGTDNRPAVAAPPSDLPSDPHEAQRQAAQWILQQQVPGAAATQQAEKKAREVYVGNLVPGQVTEEMLTNMFSEAIATLFPDVPQPHVKRCAIESGGKYAFVEFVQKEMATVALSLRGMELFGRPIAVNRPTGYCDPDDLKKSIYEQVQQAASSLGIEPPQQVKQKLQEMQDWQRKNEQEQQRDDKADHENEEDKDEAKHVEERVATGA